MTLAKVLGLQGKKEVDAYVESPEGKWMSGKPCGGRWGSQTPLPVIYRKEKSVWGEGQAGKGHRCELEGVACWLLEQAGFWP